MQGHAIMFLARLKLVFEGKRSLPHFNGFRIIGQFFRIRFITHQVFLFQHQEVIASIFPDDFFKCWDIIYPGKVFFIEADQVFIIHPNIPPANTALHILDIVLNFKIVFQKWKKGDDVTGDQGLSDKKIAGFFRIYPAIGYGSFGYDNQTIKRDLFIGNNSTLFTGPAGIEVGISALIGSQFFQPVTVNIGTGPGKES